MPSANSPQFNLPTSWKLIQATRTRTDGGVLPGPGGYPSYPPSSHQASGRIKGGRTGGGNKKYKGAATAKNNSSNSSMSMLWSPYARPPRRSKRFVLVWLGAFLVLGVLTWWVSSRARQQQQQQQQARGMETKLTG